MMRWYQFRGAGASRAGGIRPASLVRSMLYGQELSRQPVMKSYVEQKALEASNRPLRYAPLEKLGVIVVDSFPALGKLAALRFIEWVQHNPDGVDLPADGQDAGALHRESAGCSPRWDTPDDPARARARPASIRRRRATRADCTSCRSTSSIPSTPRSDNSFTHYVKHFYIEGFGLDPAKALLIDASRIGLLPGRDDSADVWPGSACRPDACATAMATNAARARAEGPARRRSTSGARSTKSASASWAASASSSAASARTATSASTCAARTTTRPRA